MQTFGAKLLRAFYLSLLRDDKQKSLMPEKNGMPDETSVSLQDAEKLQEFEAIAFQYMDSLYSTALRYTRNTQEAEDLVQDTYFRAYRFFDKFQKGTNFKAWIFKILTNTFINKYRKKVRTPQQVQLDKVAYGLEIEEEGEEQFEWNGFDESKYKELFDDEITAALSQLSDDFRMVVLLADVEGFSYKEIAQIIGRPSGTVMSRLFRGRRMLQRILEKYARREGYIRRKKE
ncbi:MAG: sigma-70 family RNA polymerase sigma factor [candidate division KSB1 bacterium]|nr:sigma-70 family RNA polymerase sigma factor [candidate division KSB1 bacterium]